MLSRYEKEKKKDFVSSFFFFPIPQEQTLNEINKHCLATEYQGSKTHSDGDFL